MYRNRDAITKSPLSLNAALRLTARAGRSPKGALRPGISMVVDSFGIY